MNDGTYVGKASQISLGKSKSGFAQIAINFELKQGGNKIWFGSLKPGKGREITMKAILAAGLENAAGALSPDNTIIKVTGKDVNLVIETDMYEGEANQKIKWVNTIDGSVFREKLSHGDAVQILAGIDIKGELMAARMAQNTGDDDSGFAPNDTDSAPF